MRTNLLAVVALLLCFTITAQKKDPKKTYTKVVKIYDQEGQLVEVDSSTIHWINNFKKQAIWSSIHLDDDSMIVSDSMPCCLKAYSGNHRHILQNDNHFQLKVPPSFSIDFDEKNFEKKLEELEDKLEKIIKKIEKRWELKD